MAITLGQAHSAFYIRTLTATNARWSSVEITECLNLAVDAAYPVWYLQGIQFLSTTAGQQFYGLHSNFRDLVSVKTGFSNYPPVEVYGCATAESANGAHVLITPYAMPVGKQLQVEYIGVHPRFSTFTDTSPVPSAYLLAYAEARAHQFIYNAGPAEDLATHGALMAQCDAEATALKAQMQEQQAQRQQVRIEQIKAGKKKR